MVRAFVSIEFTDPIIVNKVVEIQNLINQSGAKLKLVAPELLHITLEFLGDLTLKEIDSVKNIIDTLSFNHFLLDVNRPNVLPNEKHIRVVYCAIEGDVAVLTDIQRELRVKLKKSGFETDNRSFTPHLTIARVKSSQNRKELMLAVHNLSNIKCGRQKIASVKLKQSILKPEGPEYSTLHEKIANE